MVLAPESKECQHETVESATVVLLRENNQKDTIPVERCTDCNKVTSLSEENDVWYQIPRSEKSECSHEHEHMEFVEYTFEYEDSGNQVWSIQLRNCSSCDTLLERASIHLVGMP